MAGFKVGISQRTCGSSHQLCAPSAVQTQNNVLHYYGVRASKVEAVPAAAAESGAAGGAPLKRLDVFLERSVVVEGSASCADIVGDSRALLLGMSDGSLRTYSWNAQVGIAVWSEHVVQGQG